jgi:hypothetical protein
VCISSSSCITFKTERILVAFSGSQLPNLKHIGAVLQYFVVIGANLLKYIALNLPLSFRNSSTRSVPKDLSQCSQSLTLFTALMSREPIQTRLFCRRMAQLEQPNWALLLGSPFALAVAPFLSNKELFELSACSRKVLRLRYDLGSWAVRLNDTSYESFRSKRHSVPPCFEAMASFDLVTYLGSRLSVSMTQANVENVDALAGVHTLDLRWCEGIRDVSTLGGVHKLDLTRCESITDVSALGGVHTLDLSGCEGITDVSALGGVHTLTLSCCEGITDVSALGGVHTLDLSFCVGITDVSALGGVHTLDLHWCDGITDVSALGGVHTLNLSGCEGIRNVTALGGVHTLDLDDCEGITDVSALGGVHTLNLHWCEGITDVSALGGVHKLDLFCCEGITDVSALGGVHTLNLQWCAGITDVSALGGVHSLTLPSGKKVYA